MGQSISQIFGGVDPWYVPSEKLEELESWFTESYDERTQRLVVRISQIRWRAMPANPTMAIVPTEFRKAFESSLDTALDECQGDEWKTEWWIYRIWNLLEWAVEDSDYRNVSASTLEHFQKLVDMRVEERSTEPQIVLRLYVDRLRAMFYAPDFGLSEWFMYSFASWLRCLNLQPMPAYLEYMDPPFEWAPIENPENAIERSIANLIRRPIESLLEPEEVGECGICREQVEAGTEVTVLEPFCSHWFHTGCIHYVLRMNAGGKHCPACRAHIVLEEQ